MIVITGATGHLGNVLVRKLINQGKKVRVLILPGEDTVSLEGLEVEKVDGDVCAPDSLRKAFEGAEIVYHCAGIISILPGQQKQLYQVNVLGTRNVVNMCLETKVKRLVYTSSIHALSEPAPGIVFDESREFNPENVLGEYSKSKTLGTLEVIRGIKKGLDAVILCPSGIIGPYDYRISEMGKLIVDFIKGKVKACVDGAYDFVDVRDVAEGLILACDKGKKGECYILSGQQISVQQLLKFLEEISGVKAPSFRLSRQVARVAGFFNVFYCNLMKIKPLFTPFSIDVLASNSLVSCQKAQDELGYSSRSIYESIKDTVSWFRQERII
ncbi:NAD-dependent epimerase/dehydratase family protein [Candidatus Atribacteria bacterium MT.SAG.1]|nr:NAD-dependent epimerase/dehydratase family protein [Candidatus Atribacteria bacterium MT.SAG.1]